MLGRLGCRIEGSFPLLAEVDKIDLTAGRQVDPGPALFPRLEKK